jgi:predicted SnoaL-like aldol condensation-catalyzing enzyme
VFGVNTGSHKDAAIDFLILVASGKVRVAFAKHVGAGFKHHNPFLAGDASTLMEAMDENAQKHPLKVLEVKIAVQEGERVAILSRVRQSPSDRGGAVVHFFRFEGDRIAELWDIGQVAPSDSPNEHGMF